MLYENHTLEASKFLMNLYALNIDLMEDGEPSMSANPSNKNHKEFFMDMIIDELWEVAQSKGSMAIEIKQEAEIVYQAMIDLL